ncbi:MAG: hypothetical protein K0U12_06335 [Gammaproteobacteria bacterium]|nr:hypothetical protein [Gammaproteobacteria bacterium]
MKKINKHYVSEIDRRLAEFDAAQPKSAAQQAEIDKYQAIHQLRDNAEAESQPQPNPNWDNF